MQKLFQLYLLILKPPSNPSLLKPTKPTTNQTTHSLSLSSWTSIWSNGELGSMSQKNNILQRCQNSSWIPTHRSHSHSRTTHLSLLLLSLCLYLNPTVKSVTCQHFQIQPQLLLLLPPPDFPVSFIFLFLHPFFFLPPLRKFTSCQRKILGWFIFYFDASTLVFFLSIVLCSLFC